MLMEPGWELRSGVAEQQVPNSVKDKWSWAWLFCISEERAVIIARVCALDLTLAPRIIKPGHPQRESEPRKILLILSRSCHLWPEWALKKNPTQMATSYRRETRFVVPPTDMLSSSIKQNTVLKEVLCLPRTLFPPQWYKSSWGPSSELTKLPDYLCLIF